MVRETRKLRAERRSTPPVARVGPYLLGPVLGRGGMGTVYRALSAGSGQEVALKLIASHLCRKPQAVRRFAAEASALSRINHPNVVRMLDFGNLPDGTLYLATELLKGRELGQVMAERDCFDAAELVPLVHQVCAGLQAAHDRAVVHRDLKPENIFVVQERPLQVKLFDFGVAKLLDSAVRLTGAGMLVGTPRCAAPEQVDGGPWAVGPAADLYSLGVLLYTLLAGAPPFECDDAGALLYQHMKDPPPPLRGRAPGVPATVARVVHWCLEKDPRRRPPSARALASAYAAAVQQAGGPAVVAEDDEDARTTRLYQPALSPAALVVSDAPPPLVSPRRGRRAIPLWLLYTGASLGLVSLAVLSALLVWVLFG